MPATCRKGFKMTTKNIIALLAGLLFAFGLVLSGMTQPAKVIGFLNVLGLQQGISWTAAPGYWDPSLAFVMGGALCVTLIAFALQPFELRPKHEADSRSRVEQSVFWYIRA